LRCYASLAFSNTPKPLWSRVEAIKILIITVVVFDLLENRRSDDNSSYIISYFAVFEIWPMAGTRLDKTKILVSHKAISYQLFLSNRTLIYKTMVQYPKNLSSGVLLCVVLSNTYLLQIVETLFYSKIIFIGLKSLYKTLIRAWKFSSSIGPSVLYENIHNHTVSTSII
jgi:hypothetical protein